MGGDFLHEFDNTYEVHSKLINSFIQETKKCIQDIKITKIQDEEKQNYVEELEKLEREKREKVQISESIYDNICERFEKLEIKCTADILNLPYLAILNEKKYFQKIESNFNEILDRVVRLSEMNPNKFDETKWFLSAIHARKEKLKTSIDLYKISLENEIQVRDLSEEKIKNASILGIKLPKFKGYDSQMDFYTFKTEFEILVAPRIQAKLLPEYLKNNYLEGQALEIVREIDNIEEIWLHMKCSFGNVVSLLSNKLKEIENDVPLWQTKGDEKLIKAITKIKKLYDGMKQPCS